MAWTTWLTPEQTRQLKGRYPGSLDEIAMLAMETPGYADEFAKLGAWIQTYEDHRQVVEMPGVIVSPQPPEKFPRPIVPHAREQEFATLVVASLLPAPGDDAPRSRLPKRDPLPVPLVEKVLRLRYDDGKPWAVIEEELKPVFSHRKIDYVRIALNHDDLGWDRGQITLGRTENTAAGIVLPKR